MSNCCSTESDDKATSCCAITDADRLACPECGSVGPVVGVDPVRPHVGDAADAPWHFCATNGCAVVYYTDGLVVGQDQVRTRVASKGLDKPDPVCYCFSHTTDELIADRDANDGASTIRAEIRAAVANGFCACEHLNPSGNCCLPDIHRVLSA